VFVSWESTIPVDGLGHEGCGIESWTGGNSHSRCASSPDLMLGIVDSGLRVYCSGFMGYHSGMRVEGEGLGCGV